MTKTRMVLGFGPVSVEYIDGRPPEKLVITGQELEDGPVVVAVFRFRWNWVKGRYEPDNP